MTMIGAVAPGPRVKVKIHLDPIGAVLCDQVSQSLVSPFLHSRVSKTYAADALPIAERHIFRVVYSYLRFFSQPFDLAPDAKFHAACVGEIRKRPQPARKAFLVDILPISAVMLPKRTGIRWTEP